VPSSARRVAPPARIEWTLTEESKKRRKRRVNQERVGVDPSSRGQRGERSGISCRANTSPG